MITAEIEAYAAEHSSAETGLLAELADETRDTMTWAQMMVGPLEGGLLRTLVRASGARRVLEIGTFTGYSALWMAAGLPIDGELISLDNDPASTKLATRYWAKSAHGHKIRLELGDAKETLSRVSGPLDFVFIDADKRNYIHYWDTCLDMVRPGGLLVADNVLWSGSVLKPNDDAGRHLAAFNKHVAEDTRVEQVMLTVRDGMTVAIKT